MTDKEFLAQMILQAQTLREEVEVLRNIDVQAMVDKAFNEVFGVSDEPRAA